MKLVEVAPISQKVAKDSLTYFSSKEISMGDIVEVEIRKKIFKALVLNVAEAKDLKTDIKKSSFGFKKVLKVSGKAGVYPEFFKSVFETKEIFLGNFGQVAAALLPKNFLENIESLPEIKPAQKKKGFESYAFSDSLEKRIEFYEKYIKESFAEGFSVQMILPNIAEVENFSKSLSGKIDNLFTFSSETKKSFDKYKKLLEEKKPVLIISTASFLFLGRADLGTIILEHESSPAYTTLKRPFFDRRVFAKILAKTRHLDFISSDTHLSIETFALVKEKKIKEIGKTNFYFDINSKIEIVDMTEEKRKKDDFALSKDAWKIIEKNERTLIFTLRKGLASQIICHDCKTLFDDDGAPVTILKNKETGARILRNTYTGKNLPTNIRCKNCGSWNFDSLGIGTDTIEEKLLEKIPKEKVFKIDKENIKTKKELLKIIEKYEGTPGAVLVSTELSLPYLKKVDNIIVASIDTLFNVPSFRVYERVIGLLEKLIEKTEVRLLLQTRKCENPIFGVIKNKNLKTYYEADLKERKKFGWPPEKDILSIRKIGSEKEVSRLKTFFENLLKDLDFSINFRRRGKLVECFILFKIHKTDSSKENKENIRVLETIRSLPPDFEIRLNPERIF